MTTNKRIFRRRLLAVAVATVAALALTLWDAKELGRRYFIVCHNGEDHARYRADNFPNDVICTTKESDYDDDD
jgi:hypothetical protein